jgi:hypothetical protein
MYTAKIKKQTSPWIFTPPPRHQFPLHGLGQFPLDNSPWHARVSEKVALTQNNGFFGFMTNFGKRPVIQNK